MTRQRSYLPHGKSDLSAANAAEAKLNEARAFNAARICFDLMASVLEERRPLDKLLGKLFRENKRFGSQDRRLIGETIFSLCRWWGWVKVLVPNPDITVWRTLDRSCFAGNPKWFLALYAASQLDGFNLTSGPVMVWPHWNKTRGMVVGSSNETLEAKAEDFAAGYNVPVPPVTDLFPDWFATELPPALSLPELYPWLQRRPPLWLRVQSHPQELLETFDTVGASAEFSTAFPEALKLVNTKINLFETEAIRQGWVEVQDISSQCVGKICAPKPGQRWLDYCAGAGGKTLQLSSMMNNKGVIVAVDKRNWKLDDLKKRARRAGFCNIQPRQSEGDFPKVPQNSFDGVLVDAPCSCTGTWRRNPDARWSSQPDDIVSLAALQKEILSHAQKAVKNGGVLIYATCSFAIPENEGTAEWFLANYPDFTAEPFNHPLTGIPCPNGMLRVLPSDGDGDAMFIARFRKK